MLFRICLISLMLPVGLKSSPTFNQTKISECAAKGGECNENKGRPVCGTDNQTYPTRCHLIRAQCSGHQVSLKHRGICKDACMASRTYALSQQRSGFRDVEFVPKCRGDGSYAPVQCHKKVGCWCVTSQGKPIPDTTTKNGRPNCGNRPKSNQRRSPVRAPSVNGLPRMKRICVKNERLQFNGKVIEIFQNELVKRTKQPSIDKNTMSDKMIVGWKFAALDANKNHILERHEYRNLKRIIKKMVKPKRCARTFIRYCDQDRDERINQVEWGNCLSKFTASDEFDDEDDYEYTDAEDETDIAQNNFIGLQDRTTLELPSEDDPRFRENEPESGCESDRAAAQEEIQEGSNLPFYVPECTVDGRYNKVQCYQNTGYCWCVNQDTGKNIPGTSTKNKEPQCENTIPRMRPMKGCPEAKKFDFLRDLKIFLKLQIQALSNGAPPQMEYAASEDERIGTLSFVFLDKNKNKLWERKEWKTFRELVLPQKGLRKCGKKMPRYCDVNSDRKITLTEWLRCLEVEQSPAKLHTKVTTELPVASAMHSRKGPNPFESYLKSE